MNAPAAIRMDRAVRVEPRNATTPANPLGIGYELMTASQSLRPDLMFAMVLWIGLVGWALNSALLFAQRRLFGPAAMSIVVQP